MTDSPRRQSQPNQSNRHLNVANDVPATLPERRSRPWYRRLIPSRRMVVVSLLVLLVLPFGIRWTRIWLMPDVPAPFDVAAFCAAPEIEENAFEYFREALVLHQSPDGGVPWSWWEWVENGRWDDVPVEVQEWVVKEQPVVELICQAGRCETARLLPPEKYTLDTADPVVMRSRELFEVAALEALRLLHEGRTAEVADLLHECQLAGNHIGQRGSLFEQRVGIMCAGSTTQLWHHWGRRPEVTADDIQAALERLQESWQRKPLPSDALKIEYVALLNGTKPPMTDLRSGFDVWVGEKRFFGCWSLNAVTWRFNQAFPGWQLPLLWVLGEPERSARAGRLKLTEFLPMADAPFVEQRPFLEGDPTFNQTEARTAGLTPAEIQDCVKSTCYSAFDPQNQATLNAWARQAARVVILETELKLQLRIRQTESRSRSDVEKWLAEFEWAVDPCSLDGQPIFHRATDEGLKLWSVAEDGVDNDGALPGSARQWDLGTTMPWP